MVEANCVWGDFAKRVQRPAPLSVGYASLGSDFSEFSEL